MYNKNKTKWLLCFIYIEIYDYRIDADGARIDTNEACCPYASNVIRICYYSALNTLASRPMAKQKQKNKNTETCLRMNRK